MKLSCLCSHVSFGVEHLRDPEIEGMGAVYTEKGPETRTPENISGIIYRCKNCRVAFVLTVGEAKDIVEGRDTF